MTQVTSTLPGQLPEPERWQIVTFVKSLKAGQSSNPGAESNSEIR